MALEAMGWLVSVSNTWILSTDAQLHSAVGKCLMADPGVAGTNPNLVITSVEIEREIISTVILPILLNQEGQVSFWQSICTKSWLTA